jgi:hypothetical protein
MLKLIFSEKATTIWQNLHLSFDSNIKTKVEISSNFVAF